MERTLVHILRYMGQTSNNNKILINNSLCYFAIRIVYTRITMTWAKVYILGFPYLDYFFDVLTS